MYGAVPPDLGDKVCELLPFQCQFGCKDQDILRAAAAPVACYFYRRLHADNRDIICVAHIACTGARCGVAGNDYSLSAFCDKMVCRRETELFHFAGRTGAVGRVGAVPEKDDIFVGHILMDLPDD